MDDFGSKLIWVSQNENVFEVEDILTKILVRLPVKSLLMCKSVSKYWRGLISSPNFMHLHLVQSQQNPSYVFYPYLLYPSLDFWDDSIHVLTKTDGETTQSFPGCDRFYLKGMICSFNGLICCINRTSVESSRYRTMAIHICNPATRQFLLLPPNPRSTFMLLPPELRSQEDPTSNYVPDKIGISYGPTINGYKVFQFFHLEKQLYECEVYSSITGSWKSIGGIAYRPHSSSNHVCINGTVYWFSRSRIGGVEVGHILAVDREENFSIIRIPEEKIIDIFLVNLEGCLCVVAMLKSFFYGNTFDIWALQDSKESVWIKKWSDYMPVSEHKLKYIAVRKNEILFGSLRQYFFYNMGTRTWREFNWEHCRECGFSIPVAYTESLLPCNGSIDS